MLLRKKLSNIAMSLSLIMSILLTGCGSENASNVQQGTNNQKAESNGSEKPKADDKYGGTVKVRVNQQPRSIGYPVTMTPPTSTLYIAQPAMETLGRYNPDGTMGPLLAESWDLDPNAKTITVKLRKDVKFHDGTDFNAEAVKWNMDKAISAKRPLSVTVDKVDVVDPNTVRFNLKTWTSGILNDLFWIYPIASPSAFEKLGEEGMKMHPVGTGPFKFDSMQDDVGIKYVKNENYWQKGLPYLDSIEMRIIVDGNTALNSFLGKEVDVALDLRGEQVSSYKDTTDFDIVPLQTQMGLSGYGLIGNSADPNSPFADVRVRKAIDYAIDKKEIAEVLGKGYVTATNQYGLKGTWTYDEELEKYDRNIEKAKQLLAEAGYPNGFKTTITGNTGNSIEMQAIQAYLAEVGITAELNVVEPAKYNAMCMTDGWDGLIYYVFTTDTELGSLMKAHFGPDATIWGPHTIRPEKIQKLMAQFDQETDAEKRKTIAKDLQKAVFDEFHLFTPLYVNTTPYVKQKNVQDEGFFTSRSRLFTPEKMWIKK